MKTDLEDDLAEETNPVEAILDTAPDSERWDPVLGSQGERKPALYGDDDDDEDGRPQGAVMVEAGVEAAEFDQMLESDKADPEPDEISEADAERLEEDEE